ncbi:hypothetical protein DE146DRAFT_677384 [Phaeosphaeria sp. MPI-PUGE-AT-0046c]|nr:hypothetical protein DE146DRAFT_677384 [Phaeosphaeria sp. MPI-PUGE-AT-0046c]
MDQIPNSFTIEIDGKPIAKVDKSAEDRTEVKLGDDAAIFTLKNSQLQCGEWIAGRDWTENRSYGPKKVSWYKANAENEKRVQPVNAKKNGETYELAFPNGKLMVDDNGTVLVDLIGDAQNKVTVVLQK